MYLCCLLPLLIYYPTVMARYSLFVLKVPLNSKQTNKQNTAVIQVAADWQVHLTMSEIPGRSCQTEMSANGELRMVVRISLVAADLLCLMSVHHLHQLLQLVHCQPVCHSSTHRIRRLRWSGSRPLAKVLGYVLRYTMSASSTETSCYFWAGFDSILKVSWPGPILKGTSQGARLDEQCAPKLIEITWPVMLILVLILKDYLRTKFKSLPLPLSLSLQD